VDTGASPWTGRRDGCEGQVVGRCELGIVDDGLELSGVCMYSTVSFLGGRTLRFRAVNGPLHQTWVSGDVS
jgi:hypothetical protein